MHDARVRRVCSALCAGPSALLCALLGHYIKAVFAPNLSLELASTNKLFVCRACVCLTPCAPQWVRSLHPDIFVVHEALCDGSGPFSEHSMSRIFDFFSNHFVGHDLFCTPQDLPHPRPHDNNSAGAADAPNFAVEAEAVPCAMEGFRFGLPQVRMRSPEMAGKAMFFSKPLDPEHMLGFERFVFFRSLIAIVTLEGELRCIHQWSHEQWASCLKDHGFVLSPVVPSLVQHMLNLSEGYHKHTRVSPAIGGVTLDICNQCVLNTCLWTV